ncbi:MAG: hypothetical protein ABI882_05035 [Acidobacteriota bacterium]
MTGIPLLSNLGAFLAKPAFPRTSLSIAETELAIVSLKRRAGEFEPTRLAMLPLPDGLLNANFSEPNMSDESAMVEELERLVSDAEMGRLRRLAVALPEGAARSLVLTLETIPSSSTELAEVLAWKIERSFGCKPGDVRVTEKRLPTKDQREWLVTVVYERVIAQYERVFKRLGWQVGLVLPAHLAEAEWLVRAGVNEDQVLLSLNERGFVAVVVRGRYPVLVREVTCPATEREDEFHRIMVFYRDRMNAKDAPVSLHRMLVVGPSEDHQRFRKTLAEALESPVTVLDAPGLGLRLPARAPFPSFAAAAGLCTFAWA